MNVWNLIKIGKYAKKQENMTHNEKNQSTETNPDLTEMLKLRDMNFKTVVIIVFLIYKKLSTGMEDFFKEPKSNFYT